MTTVMNLPKHRQIYISLRDSIVQSGAKKVTGGLWQDLFEQIQMELFDSRLGDPLFDELYDL